MILNGKHNTLRATSCFISTLQCYIETKVQIKIELLSVKLTHTAGSYAGILCMDTELGDFSSWS